MMASGFTSDHAQPRNERLYLDRSSRSARLLNSSREARYVATLVIRTARQLGIWPMLAFEARRVPALRGCWHPVQAAVGSITSAARSITWSMKP